MIPESPIFILMGHRVIDASMWTLSPSTEPLMIWTTCASAKIERSPNAGFCIPFLTSVPDSSRVTVTRNTSGEVVLVDGSSKNTGAHSCGWHGGGCLTDFAALGGWSRKHVRREEAGNG